MSPVRTLGTAVATVSALCLVGLAAPQAHAATVTSAPGTTLGGPTWDRPITLDEGGGDAPRVSTTATAVDYAITKFTTTGSGQYTFDAASVPNSGLQTVLCVYADRFRASLPLDGLVFCDGYGGETASVSEQLDPGHTYYAVVTGWTNSDRGDYNLTVTGPTAPTVTHRSIQSGSVPTTGPTVNRPLEGSAPLQPSSSSDQFQIAGFGVTQAGSYTFDVGGNFNVFACLYSDRFDDQAPESSGIVCADVGGASAQGAAAFTATLAVNQRYVLMVTGSQPAQQGSWVANIDGPGAVISPQMHGNLVGKAIWTRPTAATPPALPSQGTQKAKFEARPFKVSATGGYQIYLGEDDQFLCVYTAPFDPSAPTKNALACNDDSGDNGVSSLLMQDLTAGTAYVLVASSWNNSTGVGPWVAEFYGAGTATTVPGAPRVTSMQDDNDGNLLVYFAPADDGNSRPSIYTGTLAPATGTPTTVTGTSPLTVPEPSGYQYGDPLTFTYTGTNSAGTSPSTELDPPTAGSITSATDTGAFGAKATFTQTPSSNLGDGYYVDAFPTGPSGNSDYVNLDPTDTSALFPALTPGVEYEIFLGHTNALGTASTTTTFTTAAATHLGSLTASAASPVFTRPEAASAPPFQSSGTAVRFQDEYFTVSAAGTYSFLASGTTDWGSFLSVVGAGFDPSSPTTATLAAATVDGASESDSVQSLSVHLTAGTYAAVVSGRFDTDDQGTAGIDVIAPAGATVTPRVSGIPGPPTLTSVTDAGTGSATVKLVPPIDPQGTITGYVATFTPPTGPAIVKSLTTQTQQTVAGLSDGTTYGVSLHAVNANGPGLETATSSYLEPAIPGTPVKPVVDQTTTTTARVVVQAPAANGLPITGYVATVEPGDLVFTGDAAGDPITLNGLTKATAYSVSVTAKNGRGSSASSAPTAFFTAGIPGTPAVSDITPGVHSGTFTFTAPDDGGAPITSYHVVLTPRSGSSAPVVLTPAPTAAGKVTVNGLLTHVDYTIAVSAINAAGEGPKSLPQTVTPAFQTPGAPVSNAVQQITDTSAVLPFTAPVDPGTDAITGYVATVVPGNRTFAVAASASSVSLTGLTPNADYTVSVHATSDAGFSQESTVQAFTTSGPPAAPVITSTVAQLTTVALTYDAPATHGSPISGYEVVATPSNGGSAVTVDSQGTSATVSGLSAATTYVITVAARNGYGLGSSTSTTIATRPAKPGAVTVMPGRHQVILVLGGSLPAGVTFHATATPLGDSHPVSTTASSTTTTLAIRGLTDGKRYSISYYLSTSGGSSTSSSTKFLAGAPAMKLTQAPNSGPRKRLQAVLTIGGTAAPGLVVEIDKVGGGRVAHGKTNSHGLLSFTFSSAAGAKFVAMTSFGSHVVKSAAVTVH